MSALNDLRLFRVYEPRELGLDGYPKVWHRIEGRAVGVKHLVREDAGHRCVRCGHPFVNGETPGEWSPCDARCVHSGPIRWDGGEGWAQSGTLMSSTSVGWDNIREMIERGDRVEAKSRVLTVHHLNGRKHDLRWWNLISVCQRCHLWLQGTVIMERVYPWEHDHYFKPHAAGWYAYAYLGESLNKMQTMRRLDELLSLERVA